MNYSAGQHPQSLEDTIWSLQTLLYTTRAQTDTSRMVSPPPVLFDSPLTKAPVHEGREEWSMFKL